MNKKLQTISIHSSQTKSNLWPLMDQNSCQSKEDSFVVPKTLLKQHHKSNLLLMIIDEINSDHHVFLKVLENKYLEIYKFEGLAYIWIVHYLNGFVIQMSGKRLLTVFQIWAKMPTRPFCPLCPFFCSSLLIIRNENSSKRNSTLNNQMLF